MAKDKSEKKDKKKKETKEVTETVEESIEVNDDVDMGDAELVKVCALYLQRPPRLTACTGYQEGEKGERRDRRTSRGPLTNCATVGAEETAEEAAQNYQERSVDSRFETIARVPSCESCSVKTTASEARRQGGRKSHPEGREGVCPSPV